jgi:hypothetical protein
MSLSKSKCLYSNNCLQFLKGAVPFTWVDISWSPKARVFRMNNNIFFQYYENLLSTYDAGILSLTQNFSMFMIRSLCYFYRTWVYKKKFYNIITCRFFSRILDVAKIQRRADFINLFWCKSTHSFCKLDHFIFYSKFSFCSGMI